VGHRGRKDDPLYRARRLLTKAHERLDHHGDTKLRGLLEAGDPRGEVRMAWHAKEAVRSIYDITDPEPADEFVDQLGDDLQDQSCPPDVRSMGRTIVRWRQHIVAWHHALVSNGPTEGVNNLIKRIKRISVNRPSKLGGRGSARRASTSRTLVSSRAWRCGGCTSSRAVASFASRAVLDATSSWRTGSCRTWRCGRSRR
jgi:hypothetical protein